jgi:Coenzyme PQQ synthesis protein D (PqqD)
VNAPKTHLDPGSIISGKTGISFSKVHEDILALDEEAGYCYSMNASAARIWELIATPLSLDDLCTALCMEFSIDKESCLRDASELITVMRDAGIVTVTYEHSD